MNDVIGITAANAYLPWRRLARSALAQAHRWANPATGGRGHRAMASWDEDPITMAVEASRLAMHRGGREDVTSVQLASTTFPFADRQNAGVLASALQLSNSVASADVAGSLRAGTAALRAGFDALGAGTAGQVLVAAADRRRAPAMSTQEGQYGDGAAAVLLGRGPAVIARLIGMQTTTVDFVDHYRQAEREFDYQWEERWVRDEGYKKIVPITLKRALELHGIVPATIRHFVLPAPFRGVGLEVARACGLLPESVVDTLDESIGDTGTAHALLMLCGVLERAEPGDRIAIAQFGQGCEVLLLEATEALAQWRPARSLAQQLASGKPETNYMRYLVFNGLLEFDKGKRAERDKPTALTTMYRRRDMLSAMVGGQCRTCGTRQFPRLRICANPECGAVDSQDAHSFADAPARVMSWSADYLVYTLDPPLHYGMVTFDGGGRLLMEFTDCEPGDVQDRTALQMVFRIKDTDDLRGFRRYFWKAVPVRGTARDTKEA